MAHVPKAHFIHGAFDRNGERFVDWLAPYFAEKGYRSNTSFDYGWTGILFALFFSKRLARMLKAGVDPGDVGVGHSSGCLILKLAADMGAPFRVLIFLNPALDRGAAFAPQIENVFVLHAPHEWPTWFARFLPWHPWGDMGRVGYKGDDPRVLNVNVESTYTHAVEGHTGVSTDKQWWGPRIAACAPEIQPAKTSPFLGK